eukprot:10816123-Karenia_brevis.AAC.1
MAALKSITLGDKLGLWISPNVGTTLNNGVARCHRPLLLQAERAALKLTTSSQVPALTMCRRMTPHTASAGSCSKQKWPR